MTVIRFPSGPRRPRGTPPPDTQMSEDALRLQATAMIHRVFVRSLLERRRPARAVLEAFRQIPRPDNR